MQRDRFCLNRKGIKRWKAEGGEGKGKKTVEMFHVHVPTLHKECNHYVMQYVLIKIKLF